MSRNHSSLKGAKTSGTAYDFRTLVLCVLLVSCKPTTVAPGSSRNTKSDSVAAGAPTNIPFAHGVMLYVNAINCEMNAEDARRLNAFAAHTPIAVEVVLVGVPGNDSIVAQKVRSDLGLTVPTRMMRAGELARFKSIGFVRMPMAMVIRGKQLSTMISGEFMPKTLGLIEAAFSPVAAQ